MACYIHAVQLSSALLAARRPLQILAVNLSSSLDQSPQCWRSFTSETVNLGSIEACALVNLCHTFVWSFTAHAEERFCSQLG